MNHPTEFTKAYISFGANLAFQGRTPAQTILDAMDVLDHRDLQFVQTASLWQSLAWPDPNDPPFINTVALYMSHLSPLCLLNRLAKVEKRFGRVRHKQNAPRTLDLDLICYGAFTAATKRVELPHPRACDRAFVLYPLQEISPDLIWPKTGVSIDDLIENLPAEARKTTTICKSV